MKISKKMVGFMILNALFVSVSAQNTKKLKKQITNYGKKIDKLEEKKHNLDQKIKHFKEEIKEKQKEIIRQNVGSTHFENRTN